MKLVSAATSESSAQNVPNRPRPRVTMVFRWVGGFSTGSWMVFRWKLDCYAEERRTSGW